MKKRVFLVSLIILVVILIISIRHDFFSITGKSLYGAISGAINIIIMGLPKIFILSPENTTYYFSIGETYTLDLNVSANFEADSWWYRLEDLRHNTLVRENVSFIPNSTFDAVRWSNKLTVWANDSLGRVGSEDVTFYVSIPNTAPVLGYIDPAMLACENGYFSYKLTASDIDEDELQFDLNPKNPFFIYKFRRIDLITEEAELFSVALVKIWVGTHDMTVYVSDGQYVDSKFLNITVIGINNAPNVKNIGVQTIWTMGKTALFTKKLKSGTQNQETEPLATLLLILLFY